MNDWERANELETALWRMARLVPETCRYHGEQVSRDMGGFQIACCDTGRVAFARREILQRARVTL